MACRYVVVSALLDLNIRLDIVYTVIVVCSSFGDHFLCVFDGVKLCAPLHRVEDGTRSITASKSANDVVELKTIILTLASKGAAAACSFVMPRDAKKQAHIRRVGPIKDRHS